MLGRQVPAKLFAGERYLTRSLLQSFAGPSPFPAVQSPSVVPSDQPFLGHPPFGSGNSDGEVLFVSLRNPSPSASWYVCAPCGLPLNYRFILLLVGVMLAPF